MSEIIKLNAKSKNLNVTLKNPRESKGIETEREEDYFKKQLEQNYEEGHLAGQKEAVENLEKDYSNRLQKKVEYMDKVLKVCNTKLSDYDKAFDEIVIRLSLTIAERIVKREILQDSIINNVLKDSIRKVLGANNMIVKLNPADFDIITSQGGSDFGRDTLSKIKFESDERIEPGGCMVETDIGNVDARISSQVNEMKKQLEAAIK
jgi:flagellar assembly protein FliH